MTSTRLLLLISGLLCVALLSSGRDGLTGDDRKMLQDPGGWEYITISDPDNGIQTTHTCFDGKPHRDQCSGTLTLGSDNKFVKKIYIHHLADTRSGSYKLDGNQVTFTDELAQQDGPYAIQLDAVHKTMVLQKQGVKMELELESEYRANASGQATKKQHQ